MVASLLASLVTFPFAPGPALAATTIPTVTLTGKLIHLADHKGPGLSAVRTADRQLVPVEAGAVKSLDSGSVITVNVAVPAKVRSVASANGTLTVRGADGKVTSTPLNAGDLAAASDGTPEPAASDLGRATVASAASTGKPLAVSAVVAAADPVGSYASEVRRLFVALVTPAGWLTTNTVTQTQVNAQVASASTYWSTVTGGGVTLTTSTSDAPRYASAKTCADPYGLWTEAASRTGFTYAPNTSLVVVLPADIANTEASGCSYGLGTVGGGVNDDGMLYVSDDAFPVLAHEVGHNMSLEHANTLQCPSASDSAHNGTIWTGASCKEGEYGDGQDVMSASSDSFAPFLSSPQSLRTGILASPAATVVSAAGTTAVTLNALGSRSGVRVAKVVDPTNSVTYYVEYRVQTAPDTLNVYGDALGVRVLRINPDTGSTVVLDPTPPSSAGGDSDATLRAGATFTSLSGAVRITTVSTNASTATLSIAIGTLPPTLPSGFLGRSPTRVLDTRVGTGAPKAKLGAGASLTLAVPGLPAGVTAVALNVTVTDPTASSFLTVYPGGGTRPGASNLNFVAAQTIPNMVLVPVGPGGTVTFYNNAGTVNVIADLVGHFAP